MEDVQADIQHFLLTLPCLTNTAVGHAEEFLWSFVLLSIVSYDRASNSTVPPASSDAEESRHNWRSNNTDV